MTPLPPDPYAVLGLDRRCTEAQIRAAYRILARQLHPDVNGGAPEAGARMQALNAAYEVLSDPDRRQAYDRDQAARTGSRSRASAGPGMRNVTTEVALRLEEFLRGTRLEVRVDDPGQAGGVETLELVVPADTAPGARFRLARAQGGFVIVRLKARPDFRFKVRGSDLRCDLRISLARARSGGPETVRGVTGSVLRIQVPPHIKRGEILRIPNEGLPRSRGGRGDVLVRVLYAPEVRVRRVDDRPTWPAPRSKP